MEIGDGHTGIDVGRLVQEKNPDAEFMVISSHPEYALDSFEIHPYDFHVKPININSFKSSIKQVLEYIESKNEIKRKHTSAEEGRLLVKTKRKSSGYHFQKYTS